MIRPELRRFHEQCSDRAECETCEVIAEHDKLLRAIQAHHDQKSDDRCYLDDETLYAAAGLAQADVTLPPREKFLANCARFYDRRCLGGDWPSYQELEAQIAETTRISAEVSRLNHDALDRAGVPNLAVGEGETFTSKRIEWLAGQCDRLREQRDRLLIIARHKSGCYSERQWPRDCDCGLYEIRQAVQAEAALSEPSPAPPEAPGASAEARLLRLFEERLATMTPEEAERCVRAALAVPVGARTASSASGSTLTLPAHEQAAGEEER